MSKQTIHILKLDCGVTCEMTFNEENAQMSCAWDPPLPFPKEIKAEVIARYFPWRNEIIEAWSKRTGKKVLMIDL